MCGNCDMLCTTNNKNNNSNQEQLIEGSAVYQLNMLETGKDFFGGRWRSCNEL